MSRKHHRRFGKVKGKNEVEIEWNITVTLDGEKVRDVVRFSLTEAREAWESACAFYIKDMAERKFAADRFHPQYANYSLDKDSCISLRQRQSFLPGVGISERSERDEKKTYRMRVQDKEKVLYSMEKLPIGQARLYMRNAIGYKFTQAERDAIGEEGIEQAVINGFIRNERGIEIDIAEEVTPSESAIARLPATSATTPTVSSYKSVLPVKVEESRLWKLHKLMRDSVNLSKESDEDYREYNLLFILCAMKEEQLDKFLLDRAGFIAIGKECGRGEANKILFKKGKPSKRKDGRRVLAVAHRDTVIDPQKGWELQRAAHFKTPSTLLDDTLHSPCFDDRLGIFTILYMLPAMGIDVDILLTTDEEKGQSTASDFSLSDAKRILKWEGEGSPYSHVVEFDRRGEDVVAYHYEDKSASWEEMKTLLKDSGFVIGNGSFSDISVLDVGAKGINVGVGYHNEHSLTSTCEVREYLSNLARYATFHQKVIDQELFFPHTGGRQKRWQSYSDTESHLWQGVSIPTEAGREKNRLELQEKVIAAISKYEMRQLETPELLPLEGVRGLGYDFNLKHETSGSLYRDEKSGDLYLSLNQKFFFVASGEENLPIAKRNKPKIVPVKGDDSEVVI